MTATCAEDEDEEDELENVPAEMKTKDGYLKDGFVIDSDGEEEDDDDYDSDADEDESEDASEPVANDGDDLLLVVDIGSELSEEDYDYESED